MQQGPHLPIAPLLVNGESPGNVLGKLGILRQCLCY